MQDLESQAIVSQPQEVDLDVSEIKIEDADVVRWLLHETERDHRKAFNDFDPFRCKFCDDPVPPREQRAHVTAHRHEKARQAALQRRLATKRLREVSKLRREARA